MARKSRKNNPNPPVYICNTQPLFKTAVYARLSNEDKEASSLENQILMIQNYISQKPELASCAVFSDNGQTGTNFNRPGFESLMDEIRNGNVNCIVVKDLSRFGRDYMEAGNLIEVVFSRLCVRFISIGDNYDSLDPHCQGDGMSIAIKNMINAYYSKDISIKIKSAFAIKKENGDFIGKYPPFGYIKSPENKNKLIIDEEAANIVRMIFRLKLNGLKTYQIVRQLNQGQIPTPSHYRYIKNIYREEKYKESQLWDYTVVKKILQNMVYLGHMPVGKSKTVGFRNQVKLPREEWVIKENTHQAIISQEDFDTISEQLDLASRHHSHNEKHAHNTPPENILQDFVFCSDCGRVYKRTISYGKDKGTCRISYICTHCNQKSPKFKYRYFHQEALFNVIYTIIRQQIDSCVNVRNMMARIRASKNTRLEQSNIDNRIQSVQKKLDRFYVMKKKIYDDFCDELMDEKEYRLIGKQHEADRNALLFELQALMDEKEKFQPEFIDRNKRVSVFERFIDTKELTREMLIELIERIEVGGDFIIKIKFRYQDEYEQLINFIKDREGCFNDG